MNRFLAECGERLETTSGAISDLRNATLIRMRFRSSAGHSRSKIRNPYLGLNYIIALEGIFPSRN